MASGPGGRNALAAACAMALLAAGPIQAQPKKTAPAGDWRTPAEISDYATTPRDAETIAYARRLQAAAPGQVRLETFGRSGEGRNLFILVVSKDGVFDPTAIHKAGRPIVLVQNAIHAGEMDGKDASLALLRDIVVTREKATLIDRATRGALEIAEAHQLQSIAFPAFGTGVGGFPLDKCARVMIDAIRAGAPLLASLRRIRFVLFGQAAYRAFVEVAGELLGRPLDGPPDCPLSS